jgi:hypothetical protein
MNIQAFLWSYVSVKMILLILASILFDVIITYFDKCLM